MPKYNTADDNHEQPELIAEPRAEYTLTPEAQAEKDAYRQRLAQLLKDPEFRKTEGFPIGTDEAILALSDPPYYTACPNPFLGEIVARWREERRALRKAKDLPDDEGQLPLTHTRQPFAADVSEGKNDPIYNAHSYHTKVPHKAIMRYILHYTDPGDIVLDGFCGTGMTGVAAQLCGDKKTVESLGYSVKDGKVTDSDGKTISRLGARKAVLVDLSPAATFIAYNYNTPVDARAFEREAKRILKELEKECGWMYETSHSDGTTGKINYTVWSDVLLCPHCSGEMTFWDVAVDKKGDVHESWDCPHCHTKLAKSPKKDGNAQKVLHAFDSVFDKALGQVIKRSKQVPVLINYSIGKQKFDKQPDRDDFNLITKIYEKEILYPFPQGKMLFKDGVWGEQWRQGYHEHITHVHHFYTKRGLLICSQIVHKIQQSSDLRARNSLMFWFDSVCISFTALNRYLKNAFSQVNRSRSGTLYVASLHSEISPEYALSGKAKRFSMVFSQLGNRQNSGINTGSSSSIKSLPSESLDYIFVDPPFGNNLMYSELNFLWESWLKVFTNNQLEAIVSTIQRKRLSEYQQLMELCFKEFFRVLKPGRWLTVEFHNSQNSVWNAIQEAMMSAGFMVSDVRTLNKQQGTFNQVTSSEAVQQDLIITAYKPTAIFEKRFLEVGGSVQGAWEFIRQHLENLPLPNLQNGVIEPTQERLPYLLYDRMVAFHIQRGLNVPLSAPEFYQGLSQRFLERESMIFTPAQAAAYDKLRLQAERVAQLALFVTDETSARQWIRQELDPATGHGPQTYGELQPRFVQQLHKSKYEALPELKILLEQSFLEDSAGRWYNPDPDKQADLEALRQKALLREFHEYERSKGRLKIFRSEAIRAGFSQAWRERQYEVIVEIAERMPETVLQEDQQLLMYYHNASLRKAEKPKQAPLM